jgi:hypothetical protein
MKDVYLARQAMFRDMAGSRQPVTSYKACVSCAECPVDALCSDNSLSGRVARVLAERGPAIVLAMRIESVFKGASVFLSE